MIGETVSHYRIHEKLGGGGMGVVYRAEDTKLHRDVALKFLPHEWSEDATAKERFLREARMAAALDHPNICTIHEIGETDDGRLFIAMACYQGETLKKKIERGPLPLDQVVEIGLRIAEGLDHAHRSRIVHRDIKPANVMVTEDGEGRPTGLKVLDFGLAKLAGGSRLTEAGSTLGTAAYMSPEQALGDEVDERTDIWSLGVVLYEMISGRLPFDKPNLILLLHAIQTEKPKPVGLYRQGLPQELERIVHRALAKDPNERYQTAAEMLRDLRPLAGSGSVAVEVADAAASDPTVVMGSDRRTAAPARGPARSRKVMFGALAGTLAAALLALALFEIGRGSRRTEQNTVPRIESVAVLPLENLTGDPEQTYFVDGMTEALTANLARIGALKVISRTSAMRYKGSDRPLPKIARELGVDAVIEGSVQRGEGIVRITVQLIDARNDRHLWAETYDRELRDVLALQSEVARAIAQEVEVQLTPEEIARLTVDRPVDSEAYEDYLRGRFHWYKFTPDQIDLALEYFESALAKDPGFAPAYFGIGDVWGARTTWGVVPPRIGLPKIEAASSKLMELDDSSAEAYNLLAKLRFFKDRDWQGAEEAFRRAIELNPNDSLVRMDYSFLLTTLKRFEEGMAQARKARELDPLNPLFIAVIGYQYLFSDQPDRAIERFKTALEADPNLIPARMSLWTALRRQHRYEEALTAGKKLFTSMGAPEVTAAMDQAESYPAAMRRAAETLIRRPYAMAILVARLYAHADDERQAMDWLEKSYQEQDLSIVHIGVDPDWDGLRSDPRFERLIEGMALPD